jgi:hypothetical protein
VGKSGMIRTQMGNHVISAMVAVYGTPCAIPPRVRIFSSHREALQVQEAYTVRHACYNKTEKEKEL